MIVILGDVRKQGFRLFSISWVSFLLGSFAPFAGLALLLFFVFHFVNSFTISTINGAAKREPTATDKTKVLRDCSML